MIYMDSCKKGVHMRACSTPEVEEQNGKHGNTRALSNPSLPLQLSIQHCRSLVAPRALLRESEPAFMGHPEGECNLTASATQKMRGVEIGSARQILAQGWGNVNVKMLLFCDVADIEVDIEVQVSRGEMRYTTEVNVA